MWTLMHRVVLRLSMRSGKAELRLFKGNLILDQKLINKMEFGSRARHDILERMMLSKFDSNA